MANETFYIVDGSAQIFRAFYAVDPSLRNSEGLPTNAIFGFTNIILSLLKDRNPKYLCVVLDDKSPSFRHELYSEYKANRSEPPEELIAQFPYFEPLCEALGIKVLRMPGFEADDIVGTLTRFCEEGSREAIIVSGDKDFGQLISDRINMFDPIKKVNYDPAGIEEKFGVRPNRFRDYLALVGDTSDNIPGVRGVGPKTAVKLLSEYGDLDNLVDNVENLKGKLKDKFVDNMEMLRLSRKLVTIVRDLPIDSSMGQFEYQGPKHEDLKPMLEKFEFRNLLKNFYAGAQSESKIDRSKFILVNNIDALSQIVSFLNEQKIIAIDTETTSLNVKEAEIVGYCLSAAEKAFYIPVKGPEGAVLINKTEVHEELKLLFDNQNITWIGQNIKYDMHILANEGLFLKGKLEDTMLLSYILNPGRKSHGLDFLSEHFLGHSPLKFKDLVDGKVIRSFDHVDLKLATEYAAEDAYITYKLYEILKPELSKDLEQVYQLEIKCITILRTMENDGVLVDRDELGVFQKELENKLENLKEKIYLEAGEEFNIQSPKQLQVILFERMALPVIRKTKTGPSTAQDVLEKLAVNSDFCREILNFRSAGKTLNTYVMPLLKLTENRPRVHTSFNQTIAETGRLSSTSPNLQNIPIGGEYGTRLRKSFIAKKGYKFVGLDYSQIELRILAHLSGDENFKKAFLEDLDIHSYTASLIFERDASEISSEERRWAKTINFGIIYGMSDFRLSDELKISRKEAGAFKKQFFGAYSKIQPYFEDIIEKAKDEGFVQTVLGRRRFLPDLHSSNFNLREGAKRIAMNSPIQGSAADIIKLAMAKFFKTEILTEFSASMLLQVHDELLFEVEENSADRFAKEAQRIMEEVYPMDVPLKVSLSVGDSWAEVH